MEPCLKTHGLTKLRTNKTGIRLTAIAVSSSMGTLSIKTRLAINSTIEITSKTANGKILATGFTGFKRG